MTHYLISVVGDGIVWRIEPKDFAAALQRRWPEVAIISEKPDEVWFEMQPARGHGYVYAHLQGEDTVVVEMVDDMRDIVAIAIWFRSIVPPELPLLLFDEGYTRDLTVTSSMTEEELAAAFLAES